MTTINSRSPQCPDDLVIEVLATTEPRVRRSAANGRSAQLCWSAESPLGRAQALNDMASTLSKDASGLAELITREVGKCATEARGEVIRAEKVLQFHAQQALAAGGATFPAIGPPGTILFTQRRPRGLAGLITPWNFPLAIPMWKLAPALAAGNAVLLKPAPEATAVALRLEELFAPLLPPGLLQVLPGGVATARAIIERVDVVSFTGSVAGGRAVTAAATARNIPVQAEMGGHNASVVLPDADLQSTAQLIAEAAMEYSGQKCTATRRVVIVGDPAGFTEALVSAVELLRKGDPASTDTVIGPVISELARQRIVDAGEAVRHQGGRLLTGTMPEGGPGWFVTPGVADGVSVESPLAQHEVFGPFVTIHPAHDLEEAMKIVNCTAFGLSAAVFTRDLDAALHLAEGFKTGLVKVNAKTTGADLHVPFGGIGDSGYGPREQGPDAADLYTLSRTVTFSPSS